MPVRLAARIAVRMMMQIEEQLALHEHPGLVRQQVPTPGASVDTSNPAIDRHFKTGHHAHTTETG